MTVVAVVFSGLMLFIVGSAMNSVWTTYNVVFAENVKGMVIGSKVNFQGVPIGSVTDMRFVEGCTSVELRVDPRKATVQDVTTARIDRLLVTGQVTIELEGFSADSQRLPENSTIPSKDDPINAVKASLPEIMHRLESTLANVDRMVVAAGQVVGPKNREAVARTLSNLEQMSVDLPPRIDSVLAAVESDLRTVPAVIADARELIGNANRVLQAGADWIGGDDARAIVASARTAIERLVELETRTVAMVREGSALLAAVRNPLQTAILTARDSLHELRGLARKLRLAPSSLLFGGHAAEVEIPAAPEGGR